MSLRRSRTNAPARKRSNLSPVKEHSTLAEIWFWTLFIVANLAGISGIMYLFSYPDTMVFPTGFLATLIQITVDKKVLEIRYKKKGVEQ